MLKHFKERIHFYSGRIRDGRLHEFIAQTLWLYSYVTRYKWQIAAYTLIGLTGTATSLISSIISKDMVDIITGHQTGALVKTFCHFQ